MELRDGNVRIVDQLSEGGMGAVYAGFDDKLRREVAIKTVRGDRLDSETRARFLREARILSQLDHPNICRIYDYVEGEESDYLVLELIRGRNLRLALAEGLDTALKLKVAEHVAHALAAAHAKGIIHRDLKLTNVMLTRRGRVKVLDFGLGRFLNRQGDDWRTDEMAPADEPSDERAEPSAAAASQSLRTERGRVLGTASAMSPEQARGEVATAASDMYSFGLLLQELFTGRPAYGAGLSRQVLLLKAAQGDTLPVTGVAPDLAALVNQLKALAPEARPTAAEAAARLRRIRGKPRRRLRWLAPTAASAALVAGGLGYTLDLRRQQRQAVAAQQEAERQRSLALAALREAQRVNELLCRQALEIAGTMPDSDERGEILELCLAPELPSE